MYFPRLSHQRILKKSLNWFSILIPIATFIIWTNSESGSWIGCSRRLSMTCVLNIRADYRRVISTLDIPIYTEMTNELQKYKLLDMKALNSLIREYKYTFKTGNDRVFNLEVRRDTNVYIPNRTSCRSDTLLRQQYTVRYWSAKHR